VVAGGQGDVDGPDLEECHGGAGGHEPADDAEHDAGGQRGHRLGPDHPGAIGRDQEGGPDRPVAELAGDGQGAEERGEQRAEAFAPGEHDGHLGRRVVETFDRDRERVEHDGEGHQTHEPGGHAVGGAGGAQLEQLGP
jgi:hypothetical protein